MRTVPIITSILTVLLFVSCETERVNRRTDLPGSVSADSIKFSAESAKSKAKFYGKFTESGKLRAIPGIIISYKTDEFDINNNDSMVAGPEGTGSFSIDINNLKPLSNFRYRAFVKNLNGVVYSPIQTGFTLPFTPGISNGSSPTNITDSSAKLYGNVVRNGGDPTLKKGFILSLNSSPPITISNSLFNFEAPVDSTKGVFILDVNGLKRGTKYFYRGYVQNRASTVYSSTRNFTTLN